MTYYQDAENIRLEEYKIRRPMDDLIESYK